MIGHMVFVIQLEAHAQSAEVRYSRLHEDEAQ